ncbi:MAG: acyl-CoA dehydrogenase family protein [Sphingomonas sp.]|uniref:acyl-CoA dehydrogenase family protein n=1 Tax=Sphingomonas sp. TaxID=28214 RepID=UPI0022756CA7|nr:acyl-CoA dehydrogenase family protein [Sphingomonas sp.]MCX8477794.1 acyl-CoA dehydrogenase family protein [Sphingomonas sp.]
MDLALSPGQIAFRDAVRAFLDAELTPAMWRGAALTSGVFAEPDVYRPWQAALEARGWLTYFWPEHAGGPGWGAVERWIFESECARAGAPLIPGMGLKLVGPVLYTYGTETQKARFLPALRSGAHIWAQGFSEPGAGSDLASLRTRAVCDGDDYVVTGQKIWTTQAQFANWLFALVRTDPDVKPQAGISFLLIDMASPGVTVRPILSASGDHELNEVFLEDVRVPVANRIGAEGEGWSIAKFLLENERGGTGYTPQLLADLDRLVAAAGPLDALLADRAVRLRLEAEALEMTELRTLHEIEAGRAPSPRSLAVKLIASEIRQGIEALAVDAFGLSGLQLPAERPFHADDAPALAGPPEAGLASARYLNARAWSIFGGTSEIQLNLIARAAPAAP